MTETGFPLRIDRVLAVPREKAYACWTRADYLKQWWTPAPWTSPEAAMEFHTGGWNRVLMRGPDGLEVEHRSVFLEIIENERIVFTDAYVRAWVPSVQPFITAIITFADTADSKTQYGVQVLHWSEADMKRHEEMGFVAGWNAVIDQLETLAKTL
jgi:uncharacterized protein YndB with AHSA1/START domain